MESFRILCCIAASLTIASSAFGASFCSDRHIEKGVKCESCHGQNKEIDSPSIKQCTVCHDSEQLAQKTKDVKPQNPHKSPHYGTQLDCVLCHVQHDEPENYCDQCHSFKFKVK